MVQRPETGIFGENLATNHLKSRGWQILGRNIRGKGGEIDILAKDRNGTLVFVEVKTLQTIPGGLMPEDHLTRAKLTKLRRMAELISSKNPELVREDRGWRIDLVAIGMGDTGEPEIKHYENISF
ncbi:MAG: YraN family protein [Patescibacteria group bacterium]